ncbi:MAG: phosphoglycerate kinase [Chloroflexi bacterium]|nr:phosphoglycerate kinase [Chloroflexota bacterium]
MSKKTINDIDWNGKRALVRVDFNVPMERGTNVISDDVRIRAALPTIQHLTSNGASVVLCTHLGRPGGKVDPALELQTVAKRLSELLEAPVGYVHDCVGAIALEQVEALKPGEVMLLENVRFYPGEEANDVEFAKGLAALADVYVNDAFGTAHRAHASTDGVAHQLPAVAGLLLERELEMLGGVLENPERPLGAIFGGAKVSDKVKVLERLVSQADAIFIGGGMAATFLKAQGHNVGTSLLEEEMVGFCGQILEKAEANGVAVYLPDDVTVTKNLESGAESKKVPVDQVPDGWMIADIGPAAIDTFLSHLPDMGTIVWNGPMGVFEIYPFDKGTEAVAKGVAFSGAVTVIGGGSTAEAVDLLGLAEEMTHVSTGGGASLEFLEGKVLPGVAALDDA